LTATAREAIIFRLWAEENGPAAKGDVMRFWLCVLLILASVAAVACGHGASSSASAGGDDDDDDNNDASPPADDDTYPQCDQRAGSPMFTIHIDPSDKGRVFDGLGAISSAGNSRYLIDYPEPQRSQILDYLFKPGYGAALQILKVEIGGDANSSSGADASHMHTADDLNCDRSYEWWLIEEAKKRNPNIKVYGLAWTSPSWILAPFCWSPEYMDYLLAWIDCGQTHGFTADYLGGWNEGLWNRRWFIRLAAEIKKRGLPTKIVGADTHGDFGWLFPDLLALDPGFAAAIDVIGVHYPCNDTGCTSSAAAIGLGKPLWASEDGGSAAVWARNINRGYIDARLTAHINWPLVAADSDGAAMAGAGVLQANQPWSGAYTIDQQIWVWAHLTQFTQPGWRYLDGAVGYLQGYRRFGSYTTLISPDGADLAVVIETTTAIGDQYVELVLDGAAPQKTLHLWASDTSSSNNDDYFLHSCDATPSGGVVRLLLQPNRLYTLSTVGGQGKGTAAGPAPAPFPLPYENDFESDTLGREARWLVTQEGSFEVAPCTGRTGQCVRQTTPELPVFWGGLQMIDTPFTLVGDGNLADYTVTVDAMPETDGTIRLLGRYAAQVPFYLPQHTGYEFSLATDGTWEIRRVDLDNATVLASGTAAAWPAGAWRTLALSMKGDQITASADGAALATATDATYATGVAGFGLGGHPGAGGYFYAQFDNLEIAAE
jgi:O-glycosyl hydrolase